MPAPKISEDRLRLAVETVNQKLREGYRPAHMGGNTKTAFGAAADDLISAGHITQRQMLYHWLACAKDRLGLEPDEGLYRPHRYHQPIPLQIVQPAPAPDPDLLSPGGRPTSVLVIGDLHQDPRHPNRLEVLTWIARYASEQRFDRIIQIGDWSTFDSVNMHDRNDTFGARFKPSIKQDLDNLIESHQAFRRGMAADYKPKLTITLGNHEYRLERFENANPETQQTYTLARDETFARFGWQVRPYAEVFYVDGVGFTHHPVNGAGRAFGGETGPQRAANKTTVPLVSGHTHKRQLHDAGKIGPQDVISMVEVGCAMPWGEVESYAKLGITGWWWGVVPMVVQGGAITDVNFVSMLTLKRKYGAAAAKAA